MNADSNRPAAAEQDHAANRIHFRHYFAGEAEGRGLLRFKTQFKVATLWLGALLWSLTIPISFYEGYKILRVGLAEAATIEIIAVTAGIIVAGAVLIAMGSGEGLWREVLHNFWRYFLLLVAAPLLLLVAWYLHTQGMGPWRDATGAVAALLVLGSFFIGSPPPPDDAEIEQAIDSAFQADVAHHLSQLLAELRGGETRLPAVGADEKSRLLRRFPQDGELAGRTLMAQPGLDGRPRITPQGFVVLMFDAGSLITCEGAVDLLSGALTGYSLRELDYRDVGLLSLDATGAQYVPPPAGTVRVRQRRLQMPAMPAAAARPSYSTTFTIGLPGNAAIRVALRDGAALAKARTFAIVDSEVAPLTDLADVRRTWAMLAAAKRGPAA